MKGRTWTGRAWLALIVLALAPMVLLTAGCGQDAPTQPGNITVIGGPVTVIIGTTPSPAPGGGAAKGPVVSVTLNGMPDGEHCDAGATPANQTKTVGVGCYLDGTINPRDANGAVIFDTSVTGDRPEAFVQRGESSAGSVTQDGTNAFNWRLTCRASGAIVLSATVKGVSSGDVTFTCK